MSKTDKDKKTEAPAPETDEAEAAGESAAPETPWADGDEAAAAQAEADESAALRADNDRLKDQLLRALAEMENLRQRTARELSDARAYAIANFARDMLNVSDNLRRALDALPEDKGESDATLTALREGVEMTERGLQQILEKHQVRRIEPQGERFDPNFHQAMFEVEDKEVPAGTVVQVAQAGYVIGERVLRPAMVGVAKGGPKPEKPAADTAAPQAGGDTAEEPASGQPGDPEQAPDAPKPERPTGGARVGARVDKSA